MTTQMHLTGGYSICTAETAANTSIPTSHPAPDAASGEAPASAIAPAAEDLLILLTSSVITAAPGSDRAVRTITTIITIMNALPITTIIIPIAVSATHSTATIPA